MQIQNPTAVMIARTAVAQDDTSGCALPLEAIVPLIEAGNRGLRASPIKLWQRASVWFFSCAPCMPGNALRRIQSGPDFLGRFVRSLKMVQARHAPMSEGSQVGWKYSWFMQAALTSIHIASIEAEYSRCICEHWQTRGALNLW